MSQARDILLMMHLSLVNLYMNISIMYNDATLLFLCLYLEVRFFCFVGIYLLLLENAQNYEKKDTHLCS